MLKLVVLSDLHLLTEGALSKSLDTAERLRIGVESINALHADADCVILAGDLADLGEAEAYHRLNDILKDLTVPHHLVLGNHDHRDVFLSVNAGHPVDANGFVQQALDLKGHRVLLLDSTMPGEHGGFFCQARRDWLAAQLDAAAGMPVIVVIHHHANIMHTNVDRIRLDEPDAFVEVLKTHPDIRQVIAGHVHLTTSGTYKGLPFTTLSGGHYSVTPHFEGTPGEQKRLDAPADYAIVLSDETSTLVHFHSYIDAAGELA